MPSVAAELAWLVDLLTQTARYAEPALAELDASLLPGVRALRAPVMERATRLWNDSVPGCPELLLVADQADCIRQDSATRLLAWLTTGGRGPAVTSYELLTEPAADRPAIRTRLRRLKEDVETRRAYRDLVAEVWRLAAPVWEKRGRRVVLEACARWMSQLDAGTPIEDLMPPRHPLTLADRLGFEDIFIERDEFALSPLYFCLSGGQVVDLTAYVHIAAPASDLLPVRKVRDAAFVADRLRVLAEPTRVHILIQLLVRARGRDGCGSSPTHEPAHGQRTSEGLTRCGPGSASPYGRPYGVRRLAQADRTADGGRPGDHRALGLSGPGFS